MLGAGGNNSPGKLGDNTSSPVHEFGIDGAARTSRATDEDEEEEEEDIVGPFGNTSDTAVGIKQGQGQGPSCRCGRRRRVAGERFCRCWSEAAEEEFNNRRKALADDRVRHDNDGDCDDDVESDEDEGLRAHAMSVPVFTDARRKKRTPASSPEGTLLGG